MPEPPAHWVSAFEDLSFLLVFPDGAGREQTLVVSDWHAANRISCSKVGNTPILAYPLSGRAVGCLRPAGGFFPADLSGTAQEAELVLSWEAGCAAWVLSRLRALGFDVSLVNAAKLRRSVGQHPEPWALDLDGMTEKLARGDLSVYDVDPLPARDVTLTPGAGEWFLESPFSPARAVADGEPLTLHGLSLGMHTLFSVGGPRVRISVGDTETVIGPRE